MSAFTRPDAVALHSRILLGWSVFDEDGNVQPVRVRRDRRGRDLRRGPKEFADVPNVEAILRRFTGRPPAAPQGADPGAEYPGVPGDPGSGHLSEAASPNAPAREARACGRSEP